jgi:hypothetical protein
MSVKRIHNENMGRGRICFGGMIVTLMTCHLKALES